LLDEVKRKHEAEKDDLHTKVKEVLNGEDFEPQDT
jgi:hypothetical protein